MDNLGTRVLISLHSSAAAEGEEAETISLITSGELMETEDGILLRYEEALDESVAATKVEMVFKQDVVTMRRSGDYDVNMVFRKGQRYEGQYHTPYGAFDLALFCTKAAFSQKGLDGEVQLQYQLDINGQFVAMHKLELYYTGKESKA